MSIDLARRTAATSTTTSADVARHVAALTARASIQDLSTLYAAAVDDHDVDRVVDCFARTGSFTRAGVTTTGSDDLRAFFTSMTERYVSMLHVTHGHVVDVLEDGAHAQGLVTGHAELALGDTLMVTAYRYDDEYAVEAGRWTFARRTLRTLYVVPAAEMATSFRDDLRIRWPGTEPQRVPLP
ncbi:MAG: hypothetical protein CMH83_21220 [Nocardioides sp.]|nr:hypothetical protein [Nocardioides sp.]